MSETLLLCTGVEGHTEEKLAAVSTAAADVRAIKTRRVSWHESARGVLQQPTFSFVVNSGGQCCGLFIFVMNGNEVWRVMTVNLILRECDRRRSETESNRKVAALDVGDTRFLGNVSCLALPLSRSKPCCLVKNDEGQEECFRNRNERG